MIKLTRKRWAFLSITVVIVVVVGLILPTVVVSWAPLAHWTCETGSVVAHEYDTWVPAVLVNSPYGGNASGLGKMPWSFPGAWNGPPPANGSMSIGMETSTSNGTSAGAFFIVNVSVSDTMTVLVAGPGANSRCSSPVTVAIESPAEYATASHRIPAPSNLSNVGEATNVSVDGRVNASFSVNFDNGFEQATEPSVSTCGGPSQTIPVSATGFQISFNVTIGDAVYLFPYTLPFLQSFQYTFPANAGTWQVDNLSAPGGPGGGWAFSYSACP